MKNLRQMTATTARADGPEGWVVALEAVVADNTDPEGMHRIKVVIPSIDEAVVHDEFVTALVPWVGAAGYGPVHAPAVGSEVLLFGRLGGPHTLFYLSRYNEDFTVPAEFADGSRGVKSDTVLRLLCDLLIQVKSQVRVEVDAPDVLLQSGGSISVYGRGARVGFLGASPAARQTLPPVATNLATCITLANAMRDLLITFGLAQ
jgi:hypothetical protein